MPRVGQVIMDNVPIPLLIPAGGLTGDKILEIGVRYCTSLESVGYIASSMRISRNHVQWALDEIVRRRKKVG